MTEYSKETSFWHLLKEKRIVIPIIQRDYAQGRIGKEYLRQRFLGQLLCALKTDTPESKLVLDFVYGSTEGEYSLSIGWSTAFDNAVATTLVSCIACWCT